MSFPPVGMPGMPPPPMAMSPPPLLSGWTEHRAPSGHPYYYHAETNQSSYVRPIHPFPATSEPSTSAIAPEPSAPKKKKKKDKTLSKTPISGTPWIRVVTAEGSVFYTHSERKESVWEVPEEIADAVRELEAQAEAARVIAETVEEVESLNLKRKAVDHEKATKKKPKVDLEPKAETVAMDEGADDDEAWQREAAAQMAAEEAEQNPPPAAAAIVEDTPTESAPEPSAQANAKQDFPLPQKIDLSPEEARALFKTLLVEQDINPLTPYDSALPLLVKDPRYVLLPNLADRHAAFNEYCLEKSRANRAAKQQQQSSAAPVDEKVKAKEAYEGLLKDELKSTRTSWDEFRKKWKKDRRFFGYGRDDKERERVFKEWRNSLGERKRREAQKAEADFFALLREHENLVTGTANGGAEPSWKDVKKQKALYSDARYDAVGSSSLREELFAAYLKARLKPNAILEEGETVAATSTDHDAGHKQSRQERAERATKERERQVAQHQAKIEKDINRSQGQLAVQEGSEEFMTLLTDAIREPTATYQDSIPLLSRSPAFSRSRLPASRKIELFNTHVGRLRERQMTALHTLFESHTPGLNAHFRDLPDSVSTSAPAVKLGLDKHPSDLRQLWEDWQAARTTRARADFDVLLEENQFVGFWAGVKRMGKEGDGTVVHGVDNQDAADEEADGEGGGGKADLKALAKGIGGKQIQDVLKHDKRYRVFDHVPEEREQWIKDFIAKMSAPKLSVHVPDKA